MKIANVCTGLFLFLTGLSFSQPAFQWASVMGGTGYDSPIGLATDANGNVFTAGNFVGTSDYDPGSGVANLVSAGSWDIFVCKLNSAGNYVWAKSFGGSAWDVCYGVATDPSGNVFVTGTFRGTVDFDPGSAVYNLSTASTTVINSFIVKLDPNGNFIWAKHLGDPTITSTEMRDITCDPSGNLFLTGVIHASCDIDPGPGVHYINPGFSRVPVIKMDGSGNFVWAVNFGGSIGLTIDIDNSGNIYCGGSFTSSPDFDPGPGTYSMTCLGTYGYHDGFLVKLTGTGGFLWAEHIGGTGLEAVNYLKVDPQGNLICAGIFTEDLYPNDASTAPTYSTKGIHDSYVSKFSSAGNLLWCGRIGGAYADLIRGLDVDASGAIYISGIFADHTTSVPGTTIDIDPGPLVSVLTTPMGSDGFYAKITSAGNLVWAHALSSGGLECAWGIHVSNSCGIYVAGEFMNTIDFDPSASSTANRTSAGAHDCFILKLAEGSTAPVVTSTATPGSAYVCAGKSATLTASGSGTLSWHSSSTSTASLGTGTVFQTPALTTNTTYYVRGGQGCNGAPVSVAAQVTVVPLPQVSVSSDHSTLCVNETAVLTATGAGTYSWSNALSGQSISVTVPSTSVYVVTGIGQNSCAASASVTITALACTGISENPADDHKICVYPNPSNGAINIHATTGTQIVISDQLGRAIRKITVPTGGQILVSGLSEGVYFVSSGEGMRAVKFVVY